MLTFDEALDRILAAVPRLGVERAPFDRALGQVTVAEIVAGDDLPPWDNSGMDGYAVRAADVAASSPAAPARLRVAGDLPAGRAPERPVEPGQAIRIMTGAPIPPGADAVVMVEKTRVDGPDVLIEAAVRPGQNIRRAGESLRKGSVALAAGTPLRPADVGLLASLGIVQVDVIRRPIVAVLSSGDELVPPDRMPGPGQIRDSNRFTLCAHLRSLGFSAIDCGNAADTEEAIEALFRRAAAQADVLVSTGGVSVGDYDLTRTVMARLGTMDFWKVSIRPGKPLAFGFIEGKPVFGLPGNPVSSLVVLDQFVRPALKRMAGHQRVRRDTWRAMLEEPVRRTPGRIEFMRAIIRWHDGRFLARLTGPQGSGVLTSLSRANGFLVIPPEVSELPVGAEVDCQLFHEEI